MFKEVKKKVKSRLVKLFLRLHGYLYQKISQYAVEIENGIHPKHRIMQYHNFFINNIDTEDIVLDVGCGNGFNTYLIAKKAKKVIGIDINKENIDYAKKKFSQSNIEYILGDILDFSYNHKFNVIVLSNVLEHIKERIKLLLKLKKLGNRFLIRVPMINRDWITLYKKELNIDYRLDQTHYVEYTTDSFLEELKKAKLVMEDFSIQFGEIWAVVSYDK